MRVIPVSGTRRHPPVSAFSPDFMGFDGLTRHLCVFDYEYFIAFSASLHCREGVVHGKRHWPCPHNDPTPQD